MKYLGIDWGSKRIGSSLGDSETKIATPFKVIGSIDEIIEIIKKEDINVIILGQPLKMQEPEKELQEPFLEFKKSLKERVSIPVELIDERLTSKAADALVGDKKTKAPRDAIAAMIILQSYIDKV